MATTTGFIDYTEQTAPSNPSASHQRLFVRSSDHLLCLVDSTGTVTALGSGLTDPMTTRGDIIVRNASNVTARLAKGAADTFLHSDGTDVAYAAVTDAMLSTSDITTNNSSTSKHGFLKKLDNNAAHFMDGTGAWSTPSGSGLAHSTLGTTSAGGSFESPAAGITYLKKITLASAGLVAGISVHVKGNNANAAGLGCHIYSDNSGAPLNVIASGRPVGSDGSGTAENNIQMNTTARWVGMPIGLWLAAGDYWLAVKLSPNGNTGAIQVAYSSGTGTDKTQAHGLRDVDISIVGTSNTTNDYSIYADILS